jgi:hypothetical protein
MESRPSLSALTTDQIMALARGYRRMAATASAPETRVALDRLAIRFAMLAALRETAVPASGTAQVDGGDGERQQIKYDTHRTGE